MSLTDPPSDSVATWCPCTCGATELYHRDDCAKVDPSHPSRDRARETMLSNLRNWPGDNRQRGR